MEGNLTSTAYWAGQMGPELPVAKARPLEPVRITRRGLLAVSVRSESARDRGG